jgi:hypothetical protein
MSIQVPWIYLLQNKELCGSANKWQDPDFDEEYAKQQKEKKEEQKSNQKKLKRAQSEVKEEKSGLTGVNSQNENVNHGIDTLENNKSAVDGHSPKVSPINRREEEAKADKESDNTIKTKKS